MKMAIRGLLLFALTIVIILGYFVYDVCSYQEMGAGIRADAAIVLGAYIEGEEPSPVFRERLNHAIELLQAGKVNCIMVTGGCPEGSSLSEAIVGRNYAIQQGVPEGKILLETNSHTTYQNLYFARKLGQENNIKTFIVVSDPYHLRRAMRIAKVLGLEAYPSGTPTSKIKSLDFLFRETLRNVKFVVYHTLWADAEAGELAVSSH